MDEPKEKGFFLNGRTTHLRQMVNISPVTQFAPIWLPYEAIPSDTRGIQPDTVALDLSVSGDISRPLPGKYIQATSGYSVSPLQ